MDGMGFELESAVDGEGVISFMRMAASLAYVLQRLRSLHSETKR